MTNQYKQKIAIISDSCGDISQNDMVKYGIFVLPMQIIIEGTSYRDGVEINVEDIYKKMKAGILPKTSTPVLGGMERLMEHLKSQGYTHVLGVMLSASLSGTSNALRMIAEDFSMESCILSSNQASVGEGAIALQAAIWREEGLPFREICKRTKRLTEETACFFSVDTLEYLAKSGRIGKATALLGTALNIKPILSFDETGTIYTAAKARGSKFVEKQLVNLVDLQFAKPEYAGRPYNLLFADGAFKEGRENLMKVVLEKYSQPQNIFTSNIGAALSAHLGDHLLGVGVQFLTMA
ncbi:MAG: DegV family protein [Lachnospiraceae bacterium]|nr:DegV family protein [Lachnospiraceae bacterium]